MHIKFDLVEFISILNADTFDDARSHKWMSEHLPFSYGCVLLYVFSLVAMPVVLKNSAPIKPKLLLFIWNGFLAIFSFWGLSIMGPCLINTIMEEGVFLGTICHAGYELNSSHTKWQFLFCVSKLAELIDTVFLLLNKKDVIFLHWYHHITVLLWGVWSWADRPSVAGVWFTTMNYFVHSIMYGYYAFRTLGFKWKHSYLITYLQISQMVVGLIVCTTALVNAEGCARAAPWVLEYGTFIYFTYFLLFVQFFIKRFSPKKIKKKKA